MALVVSIFISVGPVCGPGPVPAHGAHSSSSRSSPSPIFETGWLQHLVGSCGPSTASNSPDGRTPLETPQSDPSPPGVVLIRRYRRLESARNPGRFSISVGRGLESPTPKILLRIACTIYSYRAPSYPTLLLCTLHSTRWLPSGAKHPVPRIWRPCPT